MNILECRNITKRFPGVCALDRVDIGFRAGEVHCIVGENGAGKSTLIKCLTGVYEADQGEVLIGTKRATSKNGLFSRIAYVPQEIDLFRQMSVAENLFIPFERAGLPGLVDQKKLYEKAVPILKRFHIEADPAMAVGDIPVSQQQLLQIARATAFADYDVLMLDEPTTSLTAKDTVQLFEAVRQLKEQGKAIIFISHKLDEVFAIGDYVSVFCNGRKVNESPLAEVDVPWVVKQMTGRELVAHESFCSCRVEKDVILEVEGLCGCDFSDVDFVLHRGEILGFAGLVGAGRSELMQAIFGYLPVFTGKITFYGKPWKLGDTHFSVSHGMFYLPEERRSQGILPQMSVKSNISISALGELCHGLCVSTAKETSLACDVVQQYDIKTSDLEKEIKFLSGGNQQKAIIGRFMSASPKLLIFDEPTKGIDIGTKKDIYRLMKRLAEENQMGIILISSEMDEILKCSNRVLCMYKGKICGQYPADSPREEILSSIFGLSPVETEETING